MYAIFLLFFLFSCSSEEPNRLTGEFIYREEGEYHFNPPRSQLARRDPYPWEEGKVGKFPKITKEFFRCKGSLLNPPKPDADCGGKHSLPLIHQKENVYSILIDLLNYLQQKTQKRVVITSGHRCPQHNTYVDPSARNQTSKHLIGAEVSFYVQGLEN